MKTEMTYSFNHLTVSQEDKDRIVEEKIIIFRMNNDIIENVHPSLTHYSRLMWFGGATVAGIAGVIYILVGYFSQ